MNKPIWKVQEYVEDFPFRVYRWRHYIIILQYPNYKVNLLDFRIALSKNGNKPKVISTHSTYADALVFIKMYQHEFEMEYENKKTFLQTIIDVIKNFFGII